MAVGRHFIGNEWIGGGQDAFLSRDPATAAVIWEGPAAGAEEVALAVSSARSAIDSWARAALADRLRLIEAFAAQLKSNRESLARTISLDTGKPLWESLTEVDSMIGKAPVSIEAYNDRCRETVAVSAGVVTATRFRPHGVIAVFGPFNLPGHLPNGHIIPALIAGNTVVFKPSELAPLVAQHIAELWEAAGVTAGVINMLQGGRETGKALSTSSGLDGLFFTGSAETGKALHRAFAGRPEKILALEMGGNNPLVVWDAADLASAARLTVLSAFITSGQRCTCARRLIIPGSGMGDEFIDELTGLIKRIRVGAFTDVPEPFMGPVISDTAAEGLLSAQRALIEAGAETLVPMAPLRGIPAMLSPGLIDVSEVADRPDVEFFGPLLQLIRVRTFEEALHEANNTAFGLAAGLISDNKALREGFVGRIRAGVISVNRQTTGAGAKAPFGGIGASGNHRPSAYFAADYCSYPAALTEVEEIAAHASHIPGVNG
jgi:succinylglutamic semialdehyde dehydrogenase